MVEEAKRLQEEKVAELATKEAKKVEQEAVKQEKEQLKEAAEAPEKEALDFYKKLEEEENKKKMEQEEEENKAKADAMFASLDTDSDGKLTVAELQARPGLDTNKDGEVSEEEARFFLGADQEHFEIESFRSAGYVLVKPYLELEDAAPEEEVNEEETAGTTPEVDWHPMMTPEPPKADPHAPDHPMMTPSPEEEAE